MVESLHKIDWILHKADKVHNFFGHKMRLCAIEDPLLSLYTSKYFWTIVYVYRQSIRSNP